MMTFWTLWRLHTNMLSMSSNIAPTLALPCLAVRYRRSCCTDHLRTFGGTKRRRMIEHSSDAKTQYRCDFWATHPFRIIIWSSFLNRDIGEVHVWEEELSKTLGKYDTIRPENQHFRMEWCFLCIRCRWWNANLGSRGYICHRWCWGSSVCLRSGQSPLGTARPSAEQTEK